MIVVVQQADDAQIAVATGVGTDQVVNKVASTGAAVPTGTFGQHADRHALRALLSCVGGSATACIPGGQILGECRPDIVAEFGGQ